MDFAGVRKVLSHEDSDIRFVRAIATDQSSDGTSAVADFILRVSDMNEFPYFDGDVVALEPSHTSGAAVTTNRSIVERDAANTILGLPIVCRDEDVEAGVQNASMSLF